MNIINKYFTFPYFIKILAPGQYSPEKVVLNKSPKFSFGIKTHRKIVNDNPGKFFDLVYWLCLA